MYFRFVLFVSAALLAGCANLTSISRTSSLTYTAADKKEYAGKAIHLDAQQRIAFINQLGRICTEPSPDALSAVAGSFGASASAPGTGTAALSSALSQAIGNAGIHTQSITLMRDALYRMCEAYANGGLSNAQLASFLSRSQDLTAVVLAVEQLTGPVVGNQLQLGSNASATATATAMSATDAIKAQTAYIERLNKKLGDLRKERGKVTGDIGAIDDRLGQIETERKAAVAKQSSSDQTVKDAATTEISRLDGEKQSIAGDRTRLVADGDAIDASIKDTQKNIDEANARLAELQTKQDQAISDASARASASGSFSTPAGTRTNTDAAVVAAAVEGIVKAALSKSYVVDGCMAILTGDNSSTDKTLAILEGDAKIRYQNQINAARDECLQIVQNAVQREQNFLFAQSLVVDRSPDKECVRKWAFASDKNAMATQKWLKDHKDLWPALNDVVESDEARALFKKNNKISCS